MQLAERRYLIKFDEIIGINGYISVWKLLTNLMVIETTPDRESSPQFSPVFDAEMSCVHQVYYDSQKSQFFWREV